MANPMDDVKKRVLLRIFTSPSSVLAIAGGASALMISWAVSGNFYLNMGGLAGIVAGFGLMAYQLFFGAEKMTAQVFAEINEARRREREAGLDALESRLRGDRDPRTQTYLRHLRGLHQDFQDDLKQGKVSPLARTVLGDVENLFQAAVKYLENSYHLWETAGKMSGESKQAMLEDRDRIIEEVHESVEQLSKMVEQFHSFRATEDETEFAKLRQELDETMQAARRAEERVAAIGKSADYDIREFE